MTSESVDLSVFTGWVPFAQLPTADIPTGPGVYVVVRPSVDPPLFLDVSPAGHYQGKNPTLSVAELNAHWVPGEQVVYIGKANAGKRGKRGLRVRLNEYRKYGAGSHTTAHKGGRRIWQLADHAELLVGWRVTDDADARENEKALIAGFRAHCGTRPFANGAD